MRRSMRRSLGTSWLRLASVRWISIAHCAASKALWNSTRKASPIVLISVPLKRDQIARRIRRCYSSNSSATASLRCAKAL